MITVYLVDDHAIVRSGVRAELQTISDITVCGEAGTVPEAIAGIQRADPDVVLLDVHMPHGGGLAVLQALLATGPDRPRFLGLSVSDDPADVIALIRGGARGYVTKSIAIDELADAVRRVSSGDAVFSPKLAGYVLDAFAHTGPSHTDGDRRTPTTSAGNDQIADDGLAQRPNTGSVDQELLDTLTTREVEVMRLLARGYTYREMAGRLFISVKTVETHVSNVLRKTQQTNRHSLSRWVSVNRFE